MLSDFAKSVFCCCDAAILTRIRAGSCDEYHRNRNEAEAEIRATHEAFTE